VGVAPGAQRRPSFGVASTPLNPAPAHEEGVGR